MGMSGGAHSGVFGRRRHRRSPVMAEINVTPMVDVMLVLLVIFMVTAPLLTVGVPINLPKSNAAQVTQPKEPIIVSLNRDEEAFIGNEKVAAEELQARLAAMAAEDPTRIVYVRGDRGLAYGRVMDLLGTVSQAGFAKVSLLAEAAQTK